LLKKLSNHKPTDDTEFIQSVTELMNDKAPGLNRLPPDALKAMDATNLCNYFNFITEFWEGNVDFEEWHESQVIPVPKSGNLSDQNKWQGVKLI